MGHIDDPSLDEQIALAEQEIPIEFPQAVLNEIDAIPEPFEFLPQGREDFRQKLVFTIDGASARDFDDALHVERLAKGTLELGVHIADVSAFVKEDTALDAWARERGNSVYLPHKAFPMLPDRLSSDLCSLKPGAPRYTLSVILEVSEKGRVLGYRLVRGLIQSAFRLTYDEVDQMVQPEYQQVGSDREALVQALHLALNLSHQMRAQRVAHGGLNLDMATTKLVLDANLKVERVTQCYQTESNLLIEAFMVLANECVASYFHERGVSIPFRVHEWPDPAKLNQLAAFLKTFGIHIPAHLHEEPGQAINEMLKCFEHNPNSQVLQTQVLKALKMAEYLPEDRGHFGLASQHYAHFTSPIRRYADLIAHRRLTRLLAQAELGSEHFDDSDLDGICAHISGEERKATQAEYTFMNLALLRYARDRVGEVFDGVVTEIKGFGMFVRLNELHITGLVQLDRMDGDSYEYVPELFALCGARTGKQYRIGVSVEVRIERTDLIARKLVLGLAGSPPKQPHFNKTSKLKLSSPKQRKRRLEHREKSKARFLRLKSKKRKKR